MPYYIIRDTRYIPYQVGDLKVVPFSEDIDDALGYIKCQKLSKADMMEIPDKEFEKLRQESIDINSELLLEPIVNAGPGVYVLDCDLDSIDELGNDVVYSFEVQLDRVYKDLRYFKGKEGKELKAAIKKFKKAIKKKGQNDFSINLFNLIDPMEILKDYRYTAKKAKKGDK